MNARRNPPMPAEQMRAAACPTPMHHPLTQCSICHHPDNPRSSTQSVEFDTLVLAALDARHGFDTAHRAAEGAFAIGCWLSRRGVQITLDGQPFEPGQLSPHRALRLIEQRGLFEEDR